MIVLEFPYSSPPLTANQRMHWRKKATITRDVRELTGLLANRVPRMGTCTVELAWFVNTKHRRDVDNVTPTLKAMCDGLVDAHVVTDDTPDLMKKTDARNCVRKRRHRTYGTTHHGRHHMKPRKWRVKRWRRLDGTFFYARYQYPITNFEAFDTWAEAMEGF